MRQWDLRAIPPQMQLQMGRAQAVIGAPNGYFSNATWTQSERPGPGAWLASRVHGERGRSDLASLDG
jgi:hypothetical protein